MIYKIIAYILKKAKSNYNTKFLHNFYCVQNTLNKNDYTDLPVKKKL